MELMDQMMDRMIKNMTIEEKENLMVKMMPMMMEGIDINRMIPDTMAAAGSLITVTGIYRFITQALNDVELIEQLGEIKASLPALAEWMQSMMSAMPNMMSGMMGFMGTKIMPLMMPMMHKMMPSMMEEMPEIMDSNKTMKKMMPSMMIAVMPGCVETMVPMVEPEKQTAFTTRLKAAMDKAGIK